MGACECVGGWVSSSGELLLGSCEAEGWESMCGVSGRGGERGRAWERGGGGGVEVLGGVGGVMRMVRMGAGGAVEVVGGSVGVGGMGVTRGEELNCAAMDSALSTERKEWRGEMVAGEEKRARVVRETSTGWKMGAEGERSAVVGVGGGWEREESCGGEVERFLSRLPSGVEERLPRLVGWGEGEGERERLWRERVLSVFSSASSSSSSEVPDSSSEGGWVGVGGLGKSVKGALLLPLLLPGAALCLPPVGLYGTLDGWSVCPAMVCPCPAAVVESSGASQRASSSLKSECLLAGGMEVTGVVAVAIAAGECAGVEGGEAPEAARGRGRGREEEEAAGG